MENFKEEEGVFSRINRSKMCYTKCKFICMKKRSLTEIFVDSTIVEKFSSFKLNIIPGSTFRYEEEPRPIVSIGLNIHWFVIHE